MNGSFTLRNWSAPVCASMLESWYDGFDWIPSPSAWTTRSFREVETVTHCFGCQLVEALSLVMQTLLACLIYRTECLKNLSYFIRVERLVELILIELQPRLWDHLKTSPGEDMLRRLHWVCWKVLPRTVDNFNYEIFNTRLKHFRKCVLY